ncbi:hypothetical protein ACTD5D_05560 [Nocardia takedensis]|uniref:hypothetical protein n=1 Tax=Nocardia takedensis TaxID=259390 RepID=UPI0002DD4C51|nr:hypothetical protein [Nocardia takedensis]
MGNTSVRGGLAAAALAAVATVAVATAPSASAAVDAVAVEGSGNHVVGTTYTIQARLTGASAGLLVYFSDNGEFIGAPQVPWPPGQAQIVWKPSTPGQHILTVEQGGSVRSTVVNVTAASSGTGSAGSGSAESGTGSTSTGSATKVLATLLGGLFAGMFGSS